MKNSFHHASFITLILFIQISTAGLFTSLYGQVVAEDSLKVQLNEIRVVAAYSSITIGEAPLSLSYFIRPRHELISRPAATLDELSYTLPGVFISNRENYALGERMTIRGLGWRSQFGVRGVQVVLDDLPLTVADGQTILNMIDPAVVKRMELLRGPSSTFWGNSSGGVLYLSTKPAADAPLLQYRGYAGSYSTLKQEVQLNSRIESTRLYGYATYFDTEGFRDHSAARMFRGSLGVDHPVSAGSNLTFRIAYAGMPKAQHPGALTEADAAESPAGATPNFVSSSAGKQFDQWMAAGSWLRETGSGLLNVTVHGTYRDLSNPLPFGTIGLERLAGGLRTTYEFTGLPFDLHTGAEIKIQSDDRLETAPSNEVVVNQKETVLNQALFLRTGVPVTPRLKASAGLRFDRLTFSADEALQNELEGDRAFVALNPSLGLSYFYSGGQIFANFSTSFESPSTVELVNRPEGGSGFNQDLDPEKTLSMEAGIRGQSNAFSYDVTLFGMRVNDLIVPFQLENDGPTFFRNEGKTRHYGLESGFYYQFGQVFSARLMATLLRARFTQGEFEGNDVPGVAPFRFGAGITYRPGNHNFSLDHEWVGSYRVNSANTGSNDPYSLLHFRWSYSTSEISNTFGISPFIAVNNLFNTRYNSSVAINAFGGRFFEPGSDRNFRIGIQLSIL
jgi:iron complex outermembrane recepter protein